MKERDYMNEHGGNLEWCKPFCRGNSIWAVSCEGEIVGVMRYGHNGKFIEYRPPAGADAKARQEYYSWVLEALVGEGKLANMCEAECWECPWNDVCEAMDAEMEV